MKNLDSMHQTLTLKQFLALRVCCVCIFRRVDDDLKFKVIGRSTNLRSKFLTFNARLRLCMYGPGPVHWLGILHCICVCCSLLASHSFYSEELE